MLYYLTDSGIFVLDQFNIDRINISAIENNNEKSCLWSLKQGSKLYYGSYMVGNHHKNNEIIKIIMQRERRCLYI